MPHSPVEALKKSLRWFETSGVLTPPDGSEGVAERIVLTAGNNALEEIRRSFPQRIERPGEWILTHRRPDCCFQTALLFLLAGEKLKDAERGKTGERILEYLFLRSGLRRGALWHWSTIDINGESLWFDDNGWCAAIELYLAKRFPELDRRFGLAETGRAAAAELKEGVFRVIDSEAEVKHGSWPDKRFLGDPRQPHWGVPVCAALALTGDTGAVNGYFDKTMPRLKEFGCSEAAYAFLGAALGAALTGNRKLEQSAAELAAMLAARCDPATGLPPSDHCEAPVGTGLADLVYTVNWYAAGLALYPPERERFLKMREFLVSIQDDAGCWRGMYDLSAGTWGGGNRHEGGAAGIYTGWTNTVIALTMLR